MVFQHCVDGVVFDGVPVFCGRGKIIGVSETLAKKGVRLKLKFCTIHIIRNVHKQCRHRGKLIENALWAIQGSVTKMAYDVAKIKLRKEFGDKAWSYVGEIEPVHWCVWANIPPYNVDPLQQLVPDPLFGWCSWNFVESGNNVMLISGLRDATPFGMLRAAVAAMMSSETKRRESVAKWTVEARMLTPHASELRDQERLRAGMYHVSESS